MPNPYVRTTASVPNAYRMTSPRTKSPPPTGQVGGATEDWISKYGPVACEVFLRGGFKLGADPNVHGDVTSEKRTFEVMFNGYESPGTQEVRDFAWNCFVEGFEQGRGSVGRGGGEMMRDDSSGDGWSWGTWALVLGGVGTLGLFGYNLLVQK